METSSNMHISQEYGKRSSTMSTFQRGQGWRSAVHVLLLNKGGIERGMFKNLFIFLDKCQLLKQVINIFVYVLCRFHN